MQFLSDLFLAAAALGAAFYCFILSRRLRALGSLEGGMGSAIAVLSRQVDDLTRSLKAAQDAAGRARGTLDGQTERAEAVARKLELLVASMHDLPEDREPTRETLRDPLRAPSIWPPSTWPAEPPRRKVEPEPDPEADHGQRARVLRRRQGPGAL